MIRTLLVLVLGLAASAAQAFPVPIAAERAVSDIVLAGAAGIQSDVHAATNGQVALAVWADSRDKSAGVYAARVDGEGKVLDPLGVRIAGVFGAIGAVLWNGRDFIAVVGQTLTFIAPDMTMRTMKSGLPESFRFAAATSGSPLRLLYVDSAQFAGSVAMVDGGDGTVVARKAVWTISSIDSNAGFSATASDSGFLLLRNFYDGATRTSHAIAVRLDADGNTISSADSLLPFGALYLTDGVAGGSSGFVVVRQASNFSPRAAYFLDSAGVYQGKFVVLQTSEGGEHGLAFDAIAVVRQDGRYLAAWNTADGKGTVESWIAGFAEDTPATVVRADQWTGSTRGVALAAGGAQRLLFTSVDRRGFTSQADIFVRPLSPALLPGDPHLVTVSATQQSNVSIAAGANGFAMSWTESGTDQSVRFYVRRFSAAGVPQDPAPLVVTTLPASWLGVAEPRMRIVSNGETYLIGFHSELLQYFIRRLAARTGEWLDAQPVALPGHLYPELASNGTDALAFSIGPCAGGSAYNQCAVATRIPMSSQPPAAPVVSVRAASGAINISLASNGTDYLAAWDYGFTCPFPCLYPPYPMHAVRLRSDGTALDTAPLALDNGERYPFTSAIAWNDGRYLVAWLDGGNVRGTRVTSEGAVLDRDAEGGGVVITRGTGAVRALALDHRFVVITENLAGTTTWVAVAFRADADFEAVRAMPRTILFNKGLTLSYATLSAAVRGDVLAIAYDRVGDPESGGVFRAFFRLYGEVAHRRAAGH